MNWLGINRSTLLAILFGAVVGGASYGMMLSRGWDLPYVVGAVVVLSVLLSATTRSGMRGLTAASATFWAIVMGQRLSPRYVHMSVLDFHQTLSWGRAAAIALTLAVTCVLAGITVRASSAGSETESGKSSARRSASNP